MIYVYIEKAELIITLAAKDLLTVNDPQPDVSILNDTRVQNSMQIFSFSCRIIKIDDLQLRLTYSKGPGTGCITPYKI